MNTQPRPQSIAERWSAEDRQICFCHDTALIVRHDMARQDQLELARLLNLYRVMPAVQP